MFLVLTSVVYFVTFQNMPVFTSDDKPLEREFSRSYGSRKVCFMGAVIKRNLAWHVQIQKYPKGHRETLYMLNPV